MGKQLIKPYEISVWEDELVVDTSQSPTRSYYKENKIAVIGSDTMTGPNKIYEPVFTKKNNGEKTLSFSLKYRYYDPYVDKIVTNPFASYLINERKIKLCYDNEWYDFIIKEHRKSTDGLVWTYSAVDAFVNELSKVGYNKEFSAELGNNQDTAINLAKAAVEGTDWSIDEENSSVGKQVISEAIYNATLVTTSGLTIVNTETGQTVSNLGNNRDIYLFYNYIANQDGQYVQFILQEQNSSNYQVDDNNVIKATNYRISNNLTYYEVKNEQNVITEKGFKNGTTIVIRARNISVEYHAYRQAYNHLTIYDPIKERVVKRYSVNGLDSEIYNYTDYIYTTSDVVVNYITNGDKFNTFDNGNLQGWQEVADYTGNTAPEVNLTTYPEIASTTSLSSLTSYSQIEGYMEVKFPGVFSDYKNGIFNSGIEDNASILGSISAGQEFVFRWRGAVSGTKHGSLSQMSGNTLRVVVAKYKKSETLKNDNYVNILDKNNIILDFNTNGIILDNVIENGGFENNDYTKYLVDGVPVEPSTKYIYKYNGTNYVWDSSALTFVANGPYFHYYYMTATAKKGVSNEDLSDPNVKIGIFIYTKQDSNKYYYLQDIQLTKLYRDSNNQVVTIGNVPTASSIPIEYFYVAPKVGTAAEKVETYTSKAAIARGLGCAESAIKPIYNNNADKYLSINESNSNCYNILQSIAETFECWIDLKVQHNSNGSITLINGKPNKKICLKEYIGKDNFTGFKYGINLNTIERTVNSDEIVTKLIVTPTQSDYVDTGSVAISYASSNPSGEEYILNFDYYYNQGLIANVNDAKGDVQAYYDTLKNINRKLRAQESLQRSLENSLTQLNSQRTVYSTMIDEAKNNFNEAIQDFERLTGRTYNSYRSLKINDIYYYLSQDEEVLQYKDYYTKTGDIYKLESNPTGSPKNRYYEYLADLESNDTIIDVIGRIYSNSYVVNAYAGLLNNINKEYKNVRYQLRGSEEYSFSVGLVSVTGGSNEIRVIVSDYITPFEFTLNNELYKTDVNTKTFEISTNATALTINSIPSGYTIYNSNNQIINIGSTITATADKVQVFTLKPNQKVNGVEDVIDNLIKQKESANKVFYDKYNRFIQEGTWSSTDYIDSNLYYLDAVQVSNTSAQPQVSYSISVVEISEIEGLEDYKFNVGDKTYVEDVEFFGWSTINNVLTPAREEVIVAEVEWHLEEPDNNSITVQNYKTRFEDLFQRISATVQTVQYNEATYAKTSSLMDAFGTINQTVLLNSLTNISGKSYPLTSDGSVQIDGDAITVINLKNPANLLRLESEGLRISSDGGKTWATAINGQGINIGEVFAGQINTDKIIIGDKKNPSFRWDKAGISAYKRDVASNVYDLNTYVRFDQYGLYGIERDDNFVATSLNDVKNKASFAVTWDGFFIRNSYEGGGRVEITSSNDFRVLKTVGNEEKEVIKIGALEWNGSTTPVRGVEPSLYGIRITNDNGVETFKTGTDGNIEITGTINATGGNFNDIVTVGPTNQNHIIIDGRNINYNPSIRSSNYQDGAGYGWMINKDGDAVFNNITARGAIKTAVFEYAEIQAVGGVFLFRPSSTIKSARVDGNNLILKVEKPLLFAKISYSKIDNPSGDPQGWYEKTNYGYQLTEDTEIVAGKEYFIKDEITNGSWCKVSNYISDNIPADSTVQNILLTNGLSHVYKVIYVNTTTKEVTLQNAAAMVTGQDAVTTLEELEGGALIDMGREDGTTNYGIGVNSSDNTVNLPRRAISLFETEIKPNAENDIRVTYNYRGILGTLPHLSSENVGIVYPTYMEGKPGIYTDNMYIGNAEKYIAFYKYTEINPETQLLEEKANLRVVADQFIISADDSDLVDIVNNSVYETAVEYCLSASTITNTHGTVWMNIMPSSTEQNPYLWQRTKITYNNGNIKYLPDDGGVGNGFYVETSEGGSPGEDAIILTIQSSNGEIFRTNSDTSTLTVTIFKGSTEITSQSQLDSIYGLGQVSLQWSWKNMNDNDFVLVPDSLLEDDGFTFNIDGTMVLINKIFQCELIYNEGE